MEKNPLTVLYTYFGQEEMIKPQMDNLKDTGVRVIYIDDHSPKPLKVDGAEVYRILDDIPWNQPGARNLGFHLADGWVLSADMDHIVTKKNIEEVRKLDLSNPYKMYWLGREESYSKTVYLMHKKAFEKIGGYDEDFSGHYGYDDTLFNLMCERNLETEYRGDIRLLYDYKGASKLERDPSHNINLLNDKRGNRFNTGKTLRFKWKNQQEKN